MDGKLMSIIEIADAYGKRRQSIHKLVKQLEIEVVKRKSHDAHGQVISFISAGDYEKLKGRLEGPDSLIADTREDWPGVFYIVQLEPQFDPGRFKVGFTTDLAERIRSHRTSAPYANPITTFPCKLLWEKTAIECITQSCEQLHTEVFRTDNIEEIIGLAERFFDLMPDLANGRNNNSAIKFMGT